MYFVIDKQAGKVVQENATDLPMEQPKGTLLSNADDYIIIDTNSKSDYAMSEVELHAIAFKFRLEDGFDFDNYDQCAQAIFEAVKEHDEFDDFPLEDHIPEYQSGRKKTKATSKPKAKPEAKPKVKAETTSEEDPSPKPKAKTGTRLTAKSMSGQLFSNTDKKARETSIMGGIQTIISSNCEPMDFEMLQGVFMTDQDKDEKWANGYIAGAVREGYIVMVGAEEEDDEEW